jgi:hypothetical protein
MRTHRLPRAAAAADDPEAAKRIADAVYGTILVLAVVAALSEDESATPLAILGGALATSIVFWIVHVYADVLSRRAGGEASLWAVARDSAHREWPLVEAALLPLVPLLLGAIGVFGRSTAITLSILVGLADLAGWGYVAGRALDQSRLAAVLSAVAAVALGTVMVLLKNLVH